MSRSTSLAALLERRLVALHEHLPAALGGDVTGVHQARVASRRLREALPVFAALDRGRVVARALTSIRTITRVLGPVRELDVALGHLADHVMAHPGEVHQGAVVRRWLEQARAVRRDEMLAALDRDVTARLWRRVDRLSALITPEAVADPDWRTTLARRIRRRADALRKAIEAAGVMYAPGPLHLVRIATKKLRYAVEFAGELRLGATAAALRALKRQQELLGTIHDLEVLTGFADQAIAESPGRVRPARLVGDWHRQCRELHARYLRARPAMVRLGEAAGGELAAKVAGPRVLVARRRHRRHAHGAE